jgi:hypothetical protein
MNVERGCLKVDISPIILIKQGSLFYFVLFYMAKFYGSYTQSGLVYAQTLLLF